MSARPDPGWSAIPSTPVPSAMFGAAVGRHPPDDVDTLRTLLLAGERSRLDALERELAERDAERRDPERRAQAYSEVLIESLRLTGANGSALSDTLRPEVEKGLKRSIRDNPEVMADALYPVLGPAVRKMVASLFQPEKSGRSEPYQVEQLFLIHRETSLVLRHVVLRERFVNDADIVSGMLDAIRSFVQDAFAAPDFDGMQSLKVGDITVWVEWGPEAVLAVVVRGFAPETLRETCAEALRGIHLEHASALERFDGDTGPFASLEADLAAAIAPVGSGGRKTGIARHWLGGGLLAAAVLSIVWGVDALSERRLWDRALGKLQATPGIVVVESDRDGEVVHLTALRDPLADAPESWLAAPRFAELDVHARWVPYLSLEPPLVLRRVQTALAPDSIEGVVLDGDLLTLPGDIPLARRAGFVTRLSVVPGIGGVAFASSDASTNVEADSR